MKYIQVKQVPKNVYLINEGDEGNRFYVVLHGSLKVEKANEFRVPGYNYSMEVNERIFCYL
jgi:CRP-like cAMP-binding protein